MHQQRKDSLDRFWQLKFFSLRVYVADHFRDIWIVLLRHVQRVKSGNKHIYVSYRKMRQQRLDQRRIWLKRLTSPLRAEQRNESVCCQDNQLSGFRRFGDPVVIFSLHDQSIFIQSSVRKHIEVLID